MATKSLREYLDEYGESHRHLGTRLTHMVGIPMIVGSLPLFPLNPLVGGGMFIGGWILQFIGHHFEGKRPALVDNIFQGFIGPMFLVAETLVASGYRADLAAMMGEGDVTAR